jgi:uncharacterized protein YlaI
VSNDVECPYCEKEVEIDTDDGFGLDENELHQYECPHCEKWFVFETCISVDHYAHPADCLNEGVHTWKPVVTAPKAYTQMRCKICGEEREPTEQERLEHGIPTIEEYRKELGS